MTEEKWRKFSQVKFSHAVMASFEHLLFDLSTWFVFCFGGVCAVCGGGAVVAKKTSPFTQVPKRNQEIGALKMKEQQRRFVGLAGIWSRWTPR